MMFRTSYINFENFYNTSRYSECDFLEELILKENLDILFITNYVNYSFDFDVDCILDNVFYNELETKYDIYKGEIINKICNIIIVKKKIGKFQYCHEKFYKEFKIKPLILKSDSEDSINKNTLMCIDFSNKNFLGKQNTLIYNSSIIKYLQKAKYIIVGGLFEFRLKYLFKFINNTYNINYSNHELKFGIYCKNNKVLDSNICKLNNFTNNLVLCNIEFLENQGHLEYEKNINIA